MTCKWCNGSGLYVHEDESVNLCPGCDGLGDDSQSVTKTYPVVEKPDMDRIFAGLSFIGMFKPTTEIEDWE